ncbi:hypothetical protein EC988_004391 [Linderina pennispora]|nr:hypothetical protein EC988_004391 [Linderina pennispora]
MTTALTETRPEATALLKKTAKTSQKKRFSKAPSIASCRRQSPPKVPKGPFARLLAGYESIFGKKPYVKRVRLTGKLVVA